MAVLKASPAGLTISDEEFVRPTPTLAEQQAAMKEAMRQAVDAHVQATARSRDYDSAVSLASYVADPNPAWQAEAEAFVAWRSAVWAYVFDRLAAVQAGQEAPPESGAALVADLPVIEWPA